MEKTSHHPPYWSIVLLSGLPASGKTTLAKLILKNSKNSIVQVITYDKFIKSQLLHLKDEWKTERKYLRESFLVLAKKAIGSNFDEIENFEEGALKMLKSMESEINFSTINHEPLQPFVFIIDDNFYYQSMRYEWLKVSRSIRSGFGMIHLECSLPECIKRNEQRCIDTRVPNEVLIDMNSKCEWPLSSEDTTPFTMVINTEQVIKMVEIISFLEKVQLHPLSPVSEQNPFKELAKLETQQNLLHQADLILRELVRKEVAQSLLETKTPEILKLLKIKAIMAKKKILLSFKSSHPYCHQLELNVLKETVSTQFKALMAED